MFHKNPPGIERGKRKYPIYRCLMSLMIFMDDLWMIFALKTQFIVMFGCHVLPEGKPISLRLFPGTIVCDYLSTTAFHSRFQSLEDLRRSKGRTIT